MALKIVDAHQHLWDLGQITLPWVGNIPELNRSFSNLDYSKFTRSELNAGQSFEIEKTLYVEVDVADSDIRKEIDRVLCLCRDDSSPQSGMIASIRPGSREFLQSLDFAKSNPEIKGFRRVLHTDATPPGTCLNPEFQSSIRLLGDEALTFDLCMRREELPDAAELAKACSNTQFVLDHCGNAAANMSSDEFTNWSTHIRAIAGCDNVACKVSGFVWTIQNSDWTCETDIEPILRVVFDSSGAERVLFGGDWPVCTLSCLTFSQWINAIHRFASDWGANTPEKLFRTNAEMIYRL